MYRTSIVSISDTNCLSADGHWLRPIGNKSIYAGAHVWTDGKYIYGNEQMGGGSASYISAKSYIPMLEFDANTNTLSAVLMDSRLKTKKLDIILSQKAKYRKYIKSIITNGDIMFFIFNDMIYDLKNDRQYKIEYQLKRVNKEDMFTELQYVKDDDGDFYYTGMACIDACIDGDNIYMALNTPNFYADMFRNGKIIKVGTYRDRSIHGDDPSNMQYYNVNNFRESWDSLPATINNMMLDADISAELDNLTLTMDPMFSRYAYRNTDMNYLYMVQQTVRYSYGVKGWLFTANIRDKKSNFVLYKNEVSCFGLNVIKPELCETYFKKIINIMRG